MFAAPASAAARPANDNFAGAFQLSGDYATAAGTITDATREQGEPAPDGYNGAHNSVWWKWTATHDGSVVVDTGASTVRDIVAVYTGQTVSTLTRVASDSTSSGTHARRLVFDAVAGTTYRI